jgi:hypothetical protein
MLGFEPSRARRGSTPSAAFGWPRPQRMSKSSPHGRPCKYIASRLRARSARRPRTTSSTAKVELLRQFGDDAVSVVFILQKPSALFEAYRIQATKSAEEDSLVVINDKGVPWAR